MLEDGGTRMLQEYLKPLQSWLSDSDVTEIVINRPGEIGIERKGVWDWRTEPHYDLTKLTYLARLAAAFTRQDVTETQPICSTVLPGGARCQIVIPPAVSNGAISFTIRRPSPANHSLDDLAGLGLFGEVRAASSELSGDELTLLRLKAEGNWRVFLEHAVLSRRNIVVAGATGSGKTTLAKALTQAIPPNERLVTIEDTREMTVPHRNAVHLIYSKGGQGLAKVDARDLLVSALRMRPDRILFQELRDGAAFDYIRNVNSGHPGSITTVHAESAALAFEQLTLLVRESEGGRDLPRDDIRSLLILLVDVVVQMRRQGDRYWISEVYYEPERKRRVGH